MAENSNSGLSNNSKTLITVLLLVFAYPIGLILMWSWMNWQKWVKWIVTLPTLALLIVFLSGILSTVNPSVQIQKAKCMKQCDSILEESSKSVCVDECLQLQMK